MKLLHTVKRTRAALMIFISLGILLLSFAALFLTFKTLPSLTIYAAQEDSGIVSDLGTKIAIFLGTAAVILLSISILAVRLANRMNALLQKINSVDKKLADRLDKIENQELDQQKEIIVTRSAILGKLIRKKNDLLVS